MRGVVNHNASQGRHLSFPMLSRLPARLAGSALSSAHNPKPVLPCFSHSSSLSAVKMPEGNRKLAVPRLFDVQGWTVVVTGGGTGIGLMITQAFANNGARVYITGRREDVLQTTVQEWGTKLVHPEGKIIPIPADITDKSSIQKLAQEVAKHEDHVDVLVNNAGIDGDTSTVEKGDESAEALQEQWWSEEMSMWEDVYRTNVMG